MTTPQIPPYLSIQGLPRSPTTAPPTLVIITTPRTLNNWILTPVSILLNNFVLSVALPSSSHTIDIIVYSRRQRRIRADHFRQLLREKNLPFIYRYHKDFDEYTINQKRIRFHGVATYNPGITTRGISFDFLIIEDAVPIPNELLHGILLPWLTGFLLL